MNSVIQIRLSEDLSTRSQNKLRYAIELGIWRHQWRIAEASNNFDEMDRLNYSYERVGLP